MFITDIYAYHFEFINIDTIYSLLLVCTKGPFTIANILIIHHKFLSNNSLSLPKQKNWPILLSDFRTTISLNSLIFCGFLPHISPIFPNYSNCLSLEIIKITHSVTRVKVYSSIIPYIRVRTLYISFYNLISFCFNLYRKPIWKIF